MKREIVLGLAVIVLLSGFASYAYVGRKAKVELPCIASASEQCPPADFLKDYDGWHALKEDINEISREKDLQRKQDTLVGWANRINQQIPPGYTFNEVNRKFERRVQALPPSTPPVTK